MMANLGHEIYAAGGKAPGGNLDEDTDPPRRADGSGSEVGTVDLPGNASPLSVCSCCDAGGASQPPAARAIDGSFAGLFPGILRKSPRPRTGPATAGEGALYDDSAILLWAFFAKKWTAFAGWA